MGRNPPTAVSPSLSERRAKAPSVPLALSESSPTANLGGWCPFAEQHGSPISDEFEFYYRDVKYIGQVWTLDVVYVRDGEWDRIFLSTG